MHQGGEKERGFKNSNQGSTIKATISCKQEQRAALQRNLMKPTGSTTPTSSTGYHGYLCLVEIPSTSQRKEKWLGMDSTSTTGASMTSPQDLNRLQGPRNRCKSTGTGVPTQQSQILEFDCRCHWIRELGLGCYSVVESYIACPRPRVPSPAMQKPNRRQKASASLTFMADISPMIAFSGYTFDPTTKMSTGYSQYGWTLCQYLVFYPEVKHKFQEKLLDEGWGSKVVLWEVNMQNL